MALLTASLAYVAGTASASALFIHEDISILDVGRSDDYQSSLLFDTSTGQGTFSFLGQVFGGQDFLGSFTASGSGVVQIVRDTLSTNYSFSLLLDPATFSGFVLTRTDVLIDDEIAPSFPAPQFSVTVPGDPTDYSVCRGCYDHSGDLFPSFFSDRITISSVLTPVPLPPSLPLYAIGLIALGGLSLSGRRLSTTSADPIAATE
ncbi:hypothetical protein [Lichenifustis flavocetrariae]|uniref:PEP-CTERM sorting domain-containing protein n=1 Tax=Lichenifustis flavocetrariae TaxID=2949735 RepID=A0AA41YVX3_9HYPH|nr:hypothetical protein [Lichenifustis flavocetrariae]MCW6508201.1 hypothetical protein [Lichenifustis flavocetrariae]